MTTLDVNLNDVDLTDTPVALVLDIGDDAQPYVYDYCYNRDSALSYVQLGYEVRAINNSALDQDISREVAVLVDAYGEHFFGPIDEQQKFADTIVNVTLLIG